MRRIHTHHLPDWPELRWSADALATLLAECRYRQGRFLGSLADLGFPALGIPALQTLVDEVVKTSEIEGEILDAAEVRSSLASRLGIPHGGVTVVDRRVDGVVAMMLDATAGFAAPLTDERLFGWHAGLFPTGWSGHSRVTVGQWRPVGSGTMRVVSAGRFGREVVHFEAPAAERLPDEMTAFLDWFNGPSPDDPVIRAGLAHLWFVTIHPFDDGNGRIARAVAEMALACADQSAQRFYSMSSQIMQDRNSYYSILESTQRGSLDVTEWLDWFLRCLMAALERAEEQLASVKRKALWWSRTGDLGINARQREIVNRLLDGFNGNFTTTKWAEIAKCSPDTALRDINGLVELGVLARSPAGGRSTKYDLASG